MISGAANANAAFPVIDARQGVQEQSKRHAYMLSLLGIRNVSVLVNKMDLVGFEQSTFDRIVADIKNFLRPLGVEPNKFIPVSGMLGDNITARSDRMPWYEGETLIDALDLIDGSDELDKKFLRLPIQDVYKFDARRIIAGRIESGAIAVGDRIKIYPEGRETTVKEIACWLERDRQQSARSGESTGICVVDEFFNKRGELITRADDQPPHVSDRFRASVFWMGRTPLTLNRKYKLKLATQEVEATVEQIVRTIDASNLESKSDVTELKINDVAELIVKLKRPIAFDVFSDCQATGRFVLVDGYDVAGGGIINAAELSSADERPSFIGENVTAHGELFDEFYYDVERQEITHVASPVKQSYRINDEISTNGISYEYPGDFDVLFLREDAFISVRDKKITAIDRLERYEYSGKPLMNGRGFGIKVNSADGVQTMIEEYRRVHTPPIDRKAKAAFSNRYFFFNQFRTLKFYFDYII